MKLGVIWPLWIFFSWRVSEGLALTYLCIFGIIHPWSHVVLGCSLVGGFKHYFNLSMISLLIFPISSWLGVDGLYASRNLSIFRLSYVFIYNWLQWSHCMFFKNSCNLSSFICRITLLKLDKRLNNRNTLGLARELWLHFNLIRRLLCSPKLQ